MNNEHDTTDFEALFDAIQNAVRVHGPAYVGRAISRHHMHDQRDDKMHGFPWEELRLFRNVRHGGPMGVMLEAFAGRPPISNRLPVWDVDDALELLHELPARMMLNGVPVPLRKADARAVLKEGGNASGNICIAFWCPDEGTLVLNLAHCTVG